MDKQMLIERLLVLPKEIEAAEKRVLDAIRAVDGAKQEASKWIKHTSTNAYHARVLAEAEIRRDVVKANHNRLMNEFRALQTVAQLLAEEDTL